MIASDVSERGSPGLRYWLRTGLPVWASMAAGSKKSSAAGVAMTWTIQPRSWASLMSVPMAVAGPAPHTMTDSTGVSVSRVIGRRRSGRRTARRRGAMWAGRR